MGSGSARRTIQADNRRLATDYADLADFNPFNPRNPWLKNSFRECRSQERNSNRQVEQRPPARVRSGAVRAGAVEAIRALDHLINILRIVRPDRGQVILDLSGKFGITDRIVELALRVEQPLRIANI